ncbi:MAG: aminopeptidase [Lachnospiraceae bacterium]|nr:aminopeptidase [Lachnospiraceae bacterium]
MTEVELFQKETDYLEERYEISLERIRQIPEEVSVPEPFRDFFQKTASFIISIPQGRICKTDTPKEKAARNRMLYEDILPENYDHSYGNPIYAAERLGESFGKLFSFLYTELRGMIVYAYEDRMWDSTVLQELFIEVYNEFEQEILPEPKSIREILYWYVSDYSDLFVEERTRQMLDPACDFAVKIIEHADLTQTDYLYDFGEYITENELRTAAFLNTLSQKEIDAMAQTFTEGYRMGFVNTRKDITKKKVVNIRYNLGFERMIRAAIQQFRAMGLEPAIYRGATHVINKRLQRIGYMGAIPNKQFEYDHRNDAALYLDEDFVQRRLRVLQTAYEKQKELAAVHGGPAVVEIFGEKPFTPVQHSYGYSLSRHQQSLQVQYDNQAGQITNRYIKGEERSFTIIAYPVPEIGKDFVNIFRDTVVINTLDYHLYEQIQQIMINALDQGDRVHVKGKAPNETDLYVQLHELSNPTKETVFENCVADVNIPVGEVFTSPRLAGTEGVLHVSQVYLNELSYQNLRLVFHNGKITEYTCENFQKESENASYIQENLLFHHKTLPMGEFAIGTNTAAYVMARKYQIQDKMPILIAEKTGPHFAVGDTCYSWEEDTPVYNPDGKEIIARDNEVSALRKTDVDKAYFGCHTDITIPYEELEYIKVVKGDKVLFSIIEDGRFVLPGTENLNVPLEEEEPWQK